MVVSGPEAHIAASSRTKRAFLSVLRTRRTSSRSRSRSRRRRTSRRSRAVIERGDANTPRIAWRRTRNRLANTIPAYAAAASIVNQRPGITSAAKITTLPLAIPNAWTSGSCRTSSRRASRRRGGRCALALVNLTTRQSIVRRRNARATRRTSRTHHVPIAVRRIPTPQASSIAYANRRAGRATTGCCRRVAECAWISRSGRRRSVNVARNVNGRAVVTINRGWRAIAVPSVRAIVQQQLPHAQLREPPVSAISSARGLRSCRAWITDARSRIHFAILGSVGRWECTRATRRARIGNLHPCTSSVRR